MADTEQTFQPPKGRGRKYPTHTVLGRLMAEEGLSATIVAQRTGIHHRTLTEYLAGRATMQVKHKALLSEMLSCEPSDFDLNLGGGNDNDDDTSDPFNMAEGS